MQRRGFRGRGRLRGGFSRSRRDYRLLEYLAWISMKYKLGSEKFFKSLLRAWNHLESTCEDLTIKCRRRTRNHAVFIITKNQKIITQLQVPNHILREDSPLKEFASKEPVQSDLRKIEHPRIRDLKAGMKRVFLTAKVLELSEPKRVFTKFGIYSKVSNALIGDETGTIKLPLWNRYIGKISIGDRIQVDNAQVVIFKGELQLRVRRNGKINVIERGKG